MQFILILSLFTACLDIIWWFIWLFIYNLGPPLIGTFLFALLSAAARALCFFTSSFANFSLFSFASFVLFDFASAFSIINVFSGLVKRCVWNVFFLCFVLRGLVGVGASSANLIFLSPLSSASLASLPSLLFSLDIIQVPK